MNKRLRAILLESNRQFPQVGKPVKSELVMGSKLDGEYWQAHIIDTESTGRFEMARYPTEAAALVASVEWVREERLKKPSSKF